MRLLALTVGNKASTGWSVCCHMVLLLCWPQVELQVTCIRVISRAAVLPFELVDAARSDVSAHACHGYPWGNPDSSSGWPGLAATGAAFVSAAASQ